MKRAKMSVISANKYAVLMVAILLLGGWLASPLLSPAQDERKRGEGVKTPYSALKPSSSGEPSVNLVPEDLDDPAFNRQVDIMLLGRAWQRHDAVLLTDVGLQLSEGERVLRRRHKAIDADRVLELAAYIAADRKDEATLKRLDEVASKDEKLRPLIKTAREVARKIRPDDHPLSHTIEDLTPEGLAVHQSALRRIRAARLSGDIKTLETLEKHLATRSDLHEAQQGHLDKVIAKAKVNVNKDNKSLRATVQTLDRLAAMVASYRNTRSPH